jgi:WD40 repeat protein
MKQAPLQTYCAGLAFIPPSNELKHHFQNQIYPWVKEIRIAEADVPPPKDEFNYVCDLAFTPDGKHIAAGSNLEAARLWDVGTQNAICLFEGSFMDKVSSVSIAPDGMLLAGGSDDWTIAVWDLKTRGTL